MPNELSAIIIYDEAKSNHIIRHAEVLLLYAEALDENGKSGEALTWLNKVRTRAYNTQSAIRSASLLFTHEHTEFHPELI